MLQLTQVQKFAQAAQTLESMPLADLLKAYPLNRLAVSKNSVPLMFLTNADKTENITLVLSQPLSKAIAEGNFEEKNIAHCNVTEGKNAAGEPRLYITLPQGYGAWNDSATTIASAGAQAPVATTKTLRELMAL